ncbi:MAG: acyl-CoA dehydrogenase [Alphaproteobacteria bacterium]|nr:acyl-CoA dehydrogenase [Alphaproteobacteria bacterium]
MSNDDTMNDDTMTEVTLSGGTFKVPSPRGTPANAEPPEDWGPKDAHTPHTQSMRHYDPQRVVQEHEFVLDGVLNIEQYEGKIKGYDNVEENFQKVRDFASMSEAMHEVSHKGDRDPVKVHKLEREDGLPEVKTFLPPYIKDLYKKYAKENWTGIASSPDYEGGQGLPHSFMSGISEMHMANPGFAVLEVLTKGAVAALEEKGSEELKKEWLPRLNSGEFSGAMVMTENSYGSSLGDVETTFVLNEDGKTGQMHGHKRFLSSADHDATLGENGERNIVHMVLARTATSEGYLLKKDKDKKKFYTDKDGQIFDVDDEGNATLSENQEERKGRAVLTLALVPRVLLDKDGNYVDENGNIVDEPNTNNVRATKLNDKMGLEVQSNTDAEYSGAKGFVVGDVGEGMTNMFVIMNEARLLVGMQGTGCAEMARQNVEKYANEERRQGPGEHIINYPDSQKKIMSIRATVDAGRGISADVGLALDIARHGKDDAFTAQEKQAQQDYVDVMTPLVKWGQTEKGDKAVDDAVQLMGGQGYMRERGIAQIRNDVRISRIYEGSNPVLAIAEIATQLPKMNMFTQRAKDDLSKLDQDDPDMQDILKPMNDTIKKFDEATRHVQALGILAKKKGADSKEAGDFQAAATPFMELMYSVAAGTALAKNAQAAKNKLQNEDLDIEQEGFLESKVANAKFYANRDAARMASAHLEEIKDGTKYLDLPDLGRMEYGKGSIAKKLAKAATKALVRGHELNDEYSGRVMNLLKAVGATR